MQTPILALAGYSTGPSASAANYSGLVGSGLITPISSALANGEAIMPIAGDLSNLYIAGPAPGTAGSGKSVAVTVMLNGAAQATLEATLTDTATSANDTTGSVAVAQGDKVAIRFTPTGTPTVGATQVGILFTATTAGESAIFGGSSLTNNATNYYSFGAYRSGGATESTLSVVIPTPGVLDRLYVNQSATTGGGTAYIYTVYKNGSATGVTCTVTHPATSASDLSNTITVAKGDTISLEAAISGSPSAVRANFSMRWVPTTAGESLLLVSSAQTLSTSAERYLNANGNTANTTTESVFYNLAPTAFNVRQLYVSLATAPGTAGSGKKRGFTLAKNASTTALTTSIDDAATTGEDASNQVSVTAGDTLNYRTNPTSTPTAAGTYRIGAVAYIAPAAVTTSQNLLLLGVG